MWNRDLHFRCLKKKYFALWDLEGLMTIFKKKTPIGLRDFSSSGPTCFVGDCFTASVSCPNPKPSRESLPRRKGPKFTSVLQME